MEDYTSASREPLILWTFTLMTEIPCEKMIDLSQIRGKKSLCFGQSNNVEGGKNEGRESFALTFKS